MADKSEIPPEFERGVEKYGGKTTGRLAPHFAKEDYAINGFWADCDQKALIEFMETDIRFTKVLKQMADPANQTMRFSSICMKAGVGLIDVCNLYMDRQKRRGMMRLSGKLPRIMEDVGEDAMSRVKKCEACAGIGRIEDPENGLIECKECEGRGETRTVGNAQARELIFDTFRLTSRGGASINITNNVGNEHSSERLEDLFRKTRDISIVDVAPERPSE